MKLSDKDLYRLQYLAKQLAEANAKTEAFDAKWNALNEAFNTKIYQENLRRERKGRPLHSPYSIAQYKSDNIALNDAFAAGQWWRGKAVWLAQTILAEKAILEMMYGGAGWEPSVSPQSRS